MQCNYRYYSGIPKEELYSQPGAEEFRGSVKAVSHDQKGDRDLCT